MKTFYISSYTGNIVVDLDTNEIDSISSSREAISRLYLIKEDMHIIYGKGDNRKEFDVHKDDIVIVFYENKFKNGIVVAHSPEWVENLKAYEEEEQKIKEEWAKNKCEDSTPCTDGCPAESAN